MVETLHNLPPCTVLARRNVPLEIRRRTSTQPGLMSWLMAHGSARHTDPTPRGCASHRESIRPAAPESPLVTADDGRPSTPSSLDVEPPAGRQYNPDCVDTAGAPEWTAKLDRGVRPVRPELSLAITRARTNWWAAREMSNEAATP